MTKRDVLWWLLAVLLVAGMSWLSRDTQTDWNNVTPVGVGGK